MKRKKKAGILVGSIMLFVILVAAVTLLVLNLIDRQKLAEIDQEVLFVYRYSDNLWEDVDYGYCIDKYGNKIEVDLKTIETEGWNSRISAMLNAEEKKVTHQFSAYQMAKLYSYLYAISSGSEIERTDKPGVGFHEITAIRYREDGTLEPIRIYLDGYYYGEYPDPYAKKINQILLRKNPIHVRIENYFDR